MQPNEIVVAGPALSDPFTVRYELDCTGPNRAYFSSRRMFVRYQVDLGGVPDSLLLVPLLGSIAPIAWVLGARLRVPVVDASFLAALEVVRQSLRTMYPSIDWSGEIVADSVVDTTVDSAERSALLFSGGVDSLASYVRHNSENPLLVSIWGADIGLAQRQRWDEVAAANLEFARERGAELSLISTNFRTFFNHYKLRARFLASFENWYSGIQQGLGLVTLCAPLSHTHRLRRVLIAGTHAPDFDRPWGSHPSIDNHVRWATTEVVHDGYELTRQMKLKLLADFVRNDDHDLPIRVCWGRAVNCSHCVKCAGTIVGLLIEGLNPNDHGFRCDAGALARIRHEIETGRMYLPESAEWRWNEMQRCIPTRARVDIEGVDEFMAWLERVSMRTYRQRSRARTRARVRRYLETRPEPVGRWLRLALGHPFP